MYPPKVRLKADPAGISRWIQAALDVRREIIGGVRL